jgi:O-antigen/teichoic acid export membrane protein
VEPTRSLPRRALHAVGWSSLGTAASFLSNVVAVVWLSRLLGPAIVGATAAVLGIGSIFRASVLLPIVQALVTDSSHRADVRRAGVVLAVFSGSLGAAAFLSVGYGLSLAGVRVDYLPQLCLLVGASQLLFALSVGAVASLQRALRFRPLAVSQSVGALAGFLVVAPIVAHSPLRPLSMAVASLVAASMESAGALWSDRAGVSAPRWRGPLPLKAVARASGGFVAVGASSSLALQGDTLVVATTLGPGAAGLYSRAYRLMALPANLFGDIADAALLAAGTQVSDDQLRRALGAGGLGTLLITWPLALTGVVVADDLVRALLGSEWAASVPILRVLCLALPFRVSYKGPALILKARRRNGILTALLGAYAVLVVGLSVLGAQLGLLWVGAGVGTAVVAFYGGVSQAAGRMLAMRTNLIRDNLLAATLAVPVGLVALAVQRATSAAGLPPWVRLVLTGLTAVTTLAAVGLLVWRSSNRRLAYAIELTLDRVKGASLDPSQVVHP